MPCPVGLAWLLLGCSLYIPIAKAMPKGFDGIDVALCELCGSLRMVYAGTLQGVQSLHWGSGEAVGFVV